MKRIIYQMNDDKSQTSNKMLAGLKIIIANLAYNNTFSITDTKTKELLLSGSGTSKADALRKIKSGLKKLGVVFEDEIRNKRSLNLGE